MCRRASRRRARAAGLAVALGFACSPAPETGRAAAAKGSLERGREHYLAYGCGVCHGAEGRGDGPVSISLDPRPRDFRDPEGYRQGSSLEAIADTLRLGVRGGGRISVMPAYSHLPEDRRLELAQWIVSLQERTASASVRVEAGWARAVPPTAPNSAVYLRLLNDSDTAVALAGARSEAARAVEIHESTSKDGLMEMRQLERIVVPPGSSVELEPGGAHLMLIGLVEPLAEGSEISLTLEFSGAAELELSVPVRRE